MSETTHPTTTQVSTLITQQITHGIYGGLAGGLVFGAMMGIMGMLPMIGKMVGQPSPVAGFIVHLIISAVIGVGFSLTFARATTTIGKGLSNGLLYGGIWWLLGPLTLMPLSMGMGLGVNWNLTAATKMMPSLMGHLIFGAILGIGYVLLQRKGKDGNHGNSN